MRKPAIVQRVINSQINEIVGGGRREPIPPDMQPYDVRRGPARDDDVYEHDDDRDGYDDRDHADDDTPPFGVHVAPTTSTPQPTDPGQPAPKEKKAAIAFEIRDRLIELDDLRRRGILSEEEFAAKKSELLNRI
jgi:hypothetical protein